MLIRKQLSLLATYNSVFSIPTTSTGSGSSTSSNRWQTSTRQRRCGRQKQRTYATIVDDSSGQREHHEDEHLAWPAAPKGQSCPTPYQILAMKHKAVYNKTRFHELVKIYHPDRPSAPNDELPHTVKVERYRLIIAAHTILSDPTKRNAYDRFGAGWAGRAEVGDRDTWHQRSPGDRPGPFSHSWAHPPDDPIWQNATWEDWERFYARKARESGTAEGIHRQNHGGLYLQNSYFLLLVVILAAMGSTANYNRAQDAGTYIVEQRDIIHDRAAKELRRVKQEASQSGSKSDRIQWFIRNREAALGYVGSDLETLREEKVDRLLPDREVCRSDEVSGKDD